MNSIRDLIADDDYAISFQTMGQYRTALLKALDSAVDAPSVEEIDKVFEDNCYTDDYGTYLMQKEDFRDGVRVALSHWGCPTAPLAQVTEEVGELVGELIHVANALADEGLTGSAEPCRRAATMLSMFSQQPAPAPVETPSDEDLLAMRSWSSHGHTFDSDLVDFGRRCYNLGCQNGAAQHC
jgi:hypothetical protein